jgi:hypothetical protein
MRKVNPLSRQLAILIPGISKGVTGKPMQLGQAQHTGIATGALSPLTAHEQTGISPEALRQLIGVIGAILEDDAAPWLAAGVGRRAVQRHRQSPESRQPKTT